MSKRATVALILMTMVNVLSIGCSKAESQKAKVEEQQVMQMDSIATAAEQKAVDTDKDVDDLEREIDALQ